MEQLIGIDTNVVVRFLTGDHKKQFQVARELIAANKVFVPNTVILETEWVLRFAYGFKSERISEAFRLFMGLENVTLEAPDVISQVLSWQEGGLDFADALHLATSQKASTFATFDKQFANTAEDMSKCEIRKLQVNS